MKPLDTSRDWDACAGGPAPAYTCHATTEMSQDRGGAHCTCWYRDEPNARVCCYCRSVRTGQHENDD